MVKEAAFGSEVEGKILLEATTEILVMCLVLREDS